jgi:hypothetical protein
MIASQRTELQIKNRFKALIRKEGWNSTESNSDIKMMVERIIQKCSLGDKNSSYTLIKEENTSDMDEIPSEDEESEEDNQEYRILENKDNIGSKSQISDISMIANNQQK